MEADALWSTLLPPAGKLRVCEINPHDQHPITLPNTVHVRTVLTCGASSATARAGPARILHAGTACSTRASKTTDVKIGTCDAFIIGFYLPAEHRSAMRVSIQLELPHLLKHAAASRSLVMLHGPRCPAVPPAYPGAFWSRNLSEPCWHSTYWAGLADTLTQTNCRTSSHHAESIACSGIFEPRRSECTATPSLLDAPQTVVRKEVVTWKAASGTWKNSRRGSLKHLAHRHLRYFSAFACEGASKDGEAAAHTWFAEKSLRHSFVAMRDVLSSRTSAPPGDVCLFFKDDLNEEWVAGVSATNGLYFYGNPELVMPRVPIRAVATALPKRLRPQSRVENRGLWGQLAKQLVKSPQERTRWRRTWVDRRPERLEAIGRAAASMTHNLAMVRLPGTGAWLLVGGRHSRYADRVSFSSPVRRRDDVAIHLGIEPEHIHAPRVGVWMVRGQSWRYEARGANESTAAWYSESGLDEPEATQWSEKVLILDGRHAGCVERRDATSDEFIYLRPGTCEFDGRLSLVAWAPPGATEPELLLYTRSNRASHGSRHVQVARSRDGGATWAPFEQISFQGLHSEAFKGDIYFFGAQVNPTHNGSLLAVFPLVHRLRGCIAIVASLDGVRWSPVTNLLSCGIYGQRTLNQPAAPAMVHRGDEIWLYVHEEVPGITHDRTSPLLLRTQLEKAEERSRVVRFAFPTSILARWTESALRRLRSD